VVRCTECGEEYRFNYSTAEMFEGGMCDHGEVDCCEECYDVFVECCLTDAEDDHECGEEV